jgi:CBS domain-containing protein
MLVKDIMNKSVRTCSPANTLDEIATQMWNEDIGAMPVVDQNRKLAGIITDRDIAMAATLKHKPLWEISAAEMIDGKSCHYCHPNDEVHQALNLMGSSRIRRVPIVDDSMHLTGMIGLKDVVEHTSSQAGPRKQTTISAEELLSTYQKICKPNLLQATG